MKGSGVVFGSKSDEWETPHELFDAIEGAFGIFDLDPCSSKKNRKCLAYFTKEIDGLQQSWLPYGGVFVNPPYSQVKLWMLKCAYEASRDTRVVALVPARTDTVWWWKAMDAAKSVFFLKARVVFEIGGKPVLDDKGKPMSAPFPSAVIQFGKTKRDNRHVRWWDWREGVVK